MAKKQKRMSFEYLPCNIGSWNGKRSGEGYKHYYFKLHNGYRALQNEGYYHYDFGDGWSCNIKLEIIDVKEKKKREKISDGFCGYERMCESIIMNGEIKTDFIN